MSKRRLTPPHRTASGKHLLFEIGTEEIPSAYLPRALENLRQKSEALLETCGYTCRSMTFAATPRRFVIFAYLLSKQPDQMIERIGLSKEKAYRDGKPTQALTGFLNNVKKKETDIEWRETPRGVRAVVRLKKETKPLRYFFKSLPYQIEFPKLMRWEASRYTFTRPIRWTFALVGNKPQHFKIGDVISEPFTYGHRFLANRKLRIRRADLDSYKTLLRRNHVILDSSERKSMIHGMLKGSNNTDEELIETVRNLVEEPFLVRGTFRKDYLSLPADILSTCMRHHQKIFACYDRHGWLTNRFFAVINGRRPQSRKMIARNYENVLVARLEDAKFFYQEDAKTTLESKVPKLKEMIFLGTLGSYFDKTKRIEAAAAYLLKASAEALQDGTPSGKEEIRHQVRQAARLCKADLVSHLVYEFPELQGIAGREYARHDGLPDPVCRAIAEHYWPRNLSEDFETLKQKKMTVPGVLIALADRMDLLTGAFGIGIAPSGSQDPYALRRAAGGFVKLLRAFPLRFQLSGFINHTAGLYEPGRFKLPIPELKKKLSAFIKERLFFELKLKPGSKPYEIMEAVLAVQSDKSDCLTDVFGRFGELETLYRTDRNAFFKAWKVVERTGHILKGVKREVSDRIDPAIFEEHLETDLYRLASDFDHRLKSFGGEGKGKYRAITENFGSVFYEPIHDFFDQVMVNAEDERIRSNRQALMKKINHLYTQSVADLSFLTNL